MPPQVLIRRLVGFDEVVAFDETVKEQAIRIFETVQVDGAAVKSTLMRSVFDHMNEILRKEKQHQIDISHLTPKQRRTAMANRPYQFATAQVHKFGYFLSGSI
jgi:hypothetical protein